MKRTKQKTFSYWLLAISLWLFASCGSRKVLKESETEMAVSSQHTAISQRRNAIIEERIAISELHLSDLLEFEIEPVRDSVTYFSFEVNGKKISGVTNGRVRVKEDKGVKKVNKVEEAKSEKQTTKSEVRKADSEARTIKRQKQTERKEPYAFNIAIVVVFVLIMAFMGWMWKYKI